jgi:hypothetical protein
LNTMRGLSKPRRQMPKTLFSFFQYLS